MTKAESNMRRLKASGAWRMLTHHTKSLYPAAFRLRGVRTGSTITLQTPLHAIPAVWVTETAGPLAGTAGHAYRAREYFDEDSENFRLVYFLPAKGFGSQPCSWCDLDCSQA